MVCKPLSETQLYLTYFAGAIFPSDEISAKRNFTSVDAKFRQDDSEISFDSMKIRGCLNEILWRAFVEFLREQRTKFSKSRFQYSCTVLQLLNYHTNNIPNN